MSLRGRLAATIAVAAIAILVVGGVMTYRHALGKIAVETEAARTVAMNSVSGLVAELPASAHPQRDLDALVRTFNGDRHVRLLLIDAYGQVRLQSQLAPPNLPAPALFEELLAPRRETKIIALPARAAPIVAVMLAVVPVNEIAEVWSDLLLTLAILALFVALAFGLVFAVVGRSLAPLGDLVSAFHRIGKGDYAVVVAPRGPPELAALARGCNEMAGRLAEMARRNRRLSEQLLRLQDEERAELARDLHDDVGPFLFAIDVEAAGIAGLVDNPARDGSREAEMRERTDSIRRAARHARIEVRRILGTLRPGLLPGIGLKETLEHLLSEARARHPEVLFRLDMPEEDFGGGIEALLHRILREAVNNALRHGNPSTVSIAIRCDGASVFFRISDDGGGWPAGRPIGISEGGGYGLIGMRERVEGMGGRLQVTEIGIPAGLAVSGEVPLQERETASPDGAKALSDGGGDRRATAQGASDDAAPDVPSGHARGEAA